MPVAAVVEKGSREAPAPIGNEIPLNRYFIVNRFCIEKGWQSRDFARKFNEFASLSVPERTVCKWITGENKPRRRMLLLLSRFLRENDLYILPVDLEGHYDLAKGRG